MTEQFETAGEQLARRELVRDERLPDHYKMGQHYARLIDGDDATFDIAELTFVNALGFVMLIPLVRQKGCDWEPAGLQRAAGVFVLLPVHDVSSSFRVTQKMRAALDEMETREAGRLGRHGRPRRSPPRSGRR